MANNGSTTKVLYPIKNIFVVKKSQDFRFLVYGEGGVNRHYFQNRFEPDYYIDWGDGRVDRNSRDTETVTTHTYEDSGEYVITIKNHRMGMVLPVDMWLEILSPFPEAGVPERLAGVFYYTGLLRKICERPFYRNPQITTFYGAFQSQGVGGLPLTELPETLFEGCEHITDFTYCFELSKLKHIPDNLFKYAPNVENLWGCFSRCFDLLYIPSNLFKGCKKIKSFQATFYECNRLTGTIDRLFDDSQDVEDFSHCFYRCENLTGKAPES